MKEFPHVYSIDARSLPEGFVRLSSVGVTELESAPPAEFDGPGNRWSPEGLLLAAVADCFSLSFRASARASSLEWRELCCEARGTLDRVEGRLRFTSIELRATLRVPGGSRTDRAERLLRKAEQSCPVSASLATPIALDVTVIEE